MTHPDPPVTHPDPPVGPPPPFVGEVVNETWVEIPPPALDADGVQRAPTPEPPPSPQGGD